MTEKHLQEEIERYLRGEMTAEERQAFDAYRMAHSDVNAKVAEHRKFIGLLKQFNERQELEQRLNALHSDIDVHALAEQLTERPSFIVQLWRNHHSKISVAASIAIFAILATLFFTGYFKNSNSNYTQLRMQVENYKRSTEKLNQSTNALLNNIKNDKRITNPAKFGGTGFAITQNGYIVTNFHVVNDADAVYVQNTAGETFHARVIYTEPGYDVAVLRIDDSTFRAQGPLPYAIKKSSSSLGEEVSTLGYPGSSLVFGSGYLSSENGYRDDTTAYQVSIPVNPGNSGGPLLDTKGNIIGLISGKQTLVEGAAFAVKSSYLLKAIKNIPADSLSQKLVLGNNNALAGLSRKDQVKRMKNFVYMVKVYN